MESLEIKANVQSDWEKIVTPDSLKFLSHLLAELEGERRTLLENRSQRQKSFDAGELPGFSAQSQSIREGDWKAAAIPSDLQDRRVEITGPAEPKMIINALNSGAKVFMADFEDSLSPSWANIMNGQKGLYDAARRQIDFETSAGKRYALNKEIAVLIVRPRGLHLVEENIHFAGEAAGAAFVDFGLHVFHNAQESLEKGSGPYYYIPKLESQAEARLWAKAFSIAENFLSLPRGSIKATVLIETILAAFEMHEIMYELKEHIVGLNCGRWDYIFSYIKKLAKSSKHVLPNRNQVGMDQFFLESYSKLLIQSCHRRGVHAMGGMAAQIPIKNDAEANEQAFEKVRRDKEREAQNGHDGTWVAHPGLVKTAYEIFNRNMSGPNQIQSDKQQNIDISEKDLLALAKGSITSQGLKDNCYSALHYLAAWLNGNGCVPLHHLMEDMATAEIARAQLWQWRYHKASLSDRNEVVSLSHIQEELKQILLELESNEASPLAPFNKYRQAAGILDEIVGKDEFVDFIPSIAYTQLV